MRGVGKDSIWTRGRWITCWEQVIGSRRKERKDWEGRVYAFKSLVKVGGVERRQEH